MYINEAQQRRMAEIIDAYYIETNDGERLTRRSDAMMEDLYVNYVDKIILGIIFAPAYSFWRYAEMDDLMQEGRMAILSSIHKKQWNPAKGTIFNFFSTVVSKNLMNFTTKQNRNLRYRSDADITRLYNNQSLAYRHDMDKHMVFNDVIGMLLKFFEGKKKLEGLTILLAQYYRVNSGKRFVKKQFIQFAKGHSYSPAMVNTFFNYLKRFGRKEHVRELLDLMERGNG